MAIVILAFTVSGCGTIPWLSSSKKEHRSARNGALEPFDSLLGSSYHAADILAKAVDDNPELREKPMLAASLVSIDDLGVSSTFGRLVSEQIASRLAQRGLPIKEMKLRQDSVFIQRGQGEFLLSRELKNIGNDHDASAVLVGTYAVTEHLVFVSVRLVRTGDNTVLAGHDYQVLVSDTVHALLR